MASGHPVDSLGRVLPVASWPDDRHAPGELELVRRFCNSVNRENGAERFSSSARLDAWLREERRPAVRADADDLARVLAVREVLHELVVANAFGEAAPAAWVELARLLRSASLGLSASLDGLTVAVRSTGVDGLLGHLGLVVAGAVADGTWVRLKACRHCHWVVFDPSKNRSSRWCSMSACGGRYNAKEYRRRQAAGDAPQ
ncbi:MAG: hypothetical protein RL238_907 [Actinomycetota bacterium]|jgi:predicted RNA-binding Zn ribbon-like protein